MKKNNVTASLDDLAAKLPQIEFKIRKKKTEYYNQKMQSLRGGRQFILKTSPVFNNNKIRISLIEYGAGPGQEYFIGFRHALFDDPETIVKAIKSLERKAKCKLYYVLLISTDGEYL